MRGQLSNGLSSARRKLNRGWSATRWTQRRHKGYGLDHDSSWPKSTLRSSQLLSANVYFSTTVSNLGVHFDSQLTRRDHVTATCRSCFFPSWGSCGPWEAHWRLMRPRQWHRRSWEVGLTTATSLLYGVSEDLLRCLQSVQNEAARFITGARKYDHISPVLRDLHWPLRERIIFKIATLMHQCLNGLAPPPPYLATDCIAISSMPGRRQFRSAASGQLSSNLLNKKQD